MLAIKTVMSGHDRIPVLIFDEIDTGIGGMLAGNVARALRDLRIAPGTLHFPPAPDSLVADHHYHVFKESLKRTHGDQGQAAFGRSSVWMRSPECSAATVRLRSSMRRSCWEEAIAWNFCFDLTLPRFNAAALSYRRGNHPGPVIVYLLIRDGRKKVGYIARRAYYLPW
jgi:hypothetical protein